MIKQIDINEIHGRACRFNNEVTREVMDFHKSDWSACEVNIGKYKNHHSAVAAYREAIKRANVNVIAFERGGRVFMVKGDA